MSLLQNTSTLIAIGAALVSGLAALYARWQANAAGRANEIAIHENRLKIFKGIARFRGQVAAHGPSLKEDEVWLFSEVAELSEFYFPSNVSRGLQAVFDESLKLLSANDEWRIARESEPDKAPSLVWPRYDLSRKLRDDCTTLLGEMKPLLRVGQA